MTRKKANALPTSTRTKIARWAVDNPSASMTEVAEKFGVTVHQARYYHQQYLSGKLTRKPPKKAHTRKNRAITMKSTEELIEEQVRQAVEDLYNDAEVAPVERLDALSTAVSVRRVAQQVGLQQHLAKVKADIVAEMVRELKPEATDEDIIKLYKRAEDRVKSQA